MPCPATPTAPQGLGVHIGKTTGRAGCGCGGGERARRGAAGMGGGEDAMLKKQRERGERRVDVDAAVSGVQMLLSQIAPPSTVNTSYA